MIRERQTLTIKVTVGISYLLLIALVLPVQAGGLDSLVSLPVPTPTSTPQRSILLSLGQASQSADSSIQAMQALNFSDISIRDDKQATAWSLGYRHPLNARFSADIQYLQQGKTTPTVQATLPLGKSTEQASQETAESLPKRGEGISVLALYHQPINTKFTFQAGLGIFAWQSKRTATVGSSTYTSKSDGVSAIVQLGSSYPVTRNTRVEAQWRHTFMKGEAVDRVGIGLAVGF